MKATINGQPVEGTPEEIAQLLALAKSAGPAPALRMPQWVDKTRPATEGSQKPPSTS
jgi:hypothetical protein